MSRHHDGARIHHCVALGYRTMTLENELARAARTIRTTPRTWSGER